MTREEEIEKEAKRVSWNSDEYDYFILGAEWADSNPPKGTSIIKWQTGEPKGEGIYIVTYRHDSKGHISALFYVAGLWLSGDYDEVQKDKVIAWCKLSDVEPYKE